MDTDKAHELATQARSLTKLAYRTVDDLRRVMAELESLFSLDNETDKETD